MVVRSSYKARSARSLVCSRVVLCLGMWWGGSACVGGDAPGDPPATGSAGKAGGSSSAKAGASGAAGAGASAPLKAGSKDSHFPLVNGATWKYHHENPTKAAWDEVASVTSTTYMDKPAFSFTDEEDAQGERTTSTMVVEGTRVYRVYKEVAVAGQVAVKTAYDPAFLRYDEAWLTEGQQVTLDDDWTQTCVFTSSASKCAPGAVRTGSTKHSYKVVKLHSEVTVPAGTFDCVQIERVNPGDAETKHFWFAKGVGKVRELDTSSNATEELMQYDIP